MKNSPVSDRHDDGLTMIEIIIVLVVVALFLVVAGVIAT